MFQSFESGEGVVRMRVSIMAGCVRSTEACKFVDEVLELNPEYNNFPQVTNLCFPDA